MFGALCVQSMKLDIKNGHSIEELLQSLSETIAWCSSRPKPWNAMRSFRSPEIAPEFGSTSRKEWVDSVISQRKHLFGGKIELNKDILYKGQLLIYFPDESLDHGLEESETEGFVTETNVPPWDTWIAYLYGKNENYLVSWVPNEMIKLVDDGINVSPEECFNWLGLRANELKDTLKLNGIELGYIT